MSDTRGASGAPPSTAPKPAKPRRFGQRRAPRRIVSLRTRLVALAAIAMTLLIAERITDIVNLHAENMVATEKLVMELTEQGSSHFEHVLTDVRAVLTTLSVDPDSVADGSSCALLRRVVEASSTLAALLILDGDGILTCTSSASGVGMDLSGRDYYLIAMQGIPALSSIARSYATSAPSVFASQPVFGPNGAVTHVLLARVALTDLFPRSVINAIDPHAELLMVDPAGVLIETDPPSPALIGRNLRHTEFVSAALTRSRGTVVAESLDGTMRVYGFLRLPGSNMHLLVGVDRSRVTQAVERATWRAASVLAIASMIIFLGLWFAGETLIVTPVQMLAKRLSSFGRGEDAPKIRNEIVITELQPLVTAFETMADELTSRESALRSANRRLNSLASLDPLTGIANRRSFDSVLALQWSTAPLLGVLMIDIDHFKKFNDHYGHAKGDDCIRLVAQTMITTLRGTDVLARIGGEEFAVLMPGAPLNAAVEAAQRLRQAVEAAAIPHMGNPNGVVTVSIGCAALHPSPEATSADLMLAADQALYAAKAGGRNRVCTPEPPPSTPVPDTIADPEG